MATVRWWVALAKRLNIEARPCTANEVLVIAARVGHRRRQRLADGGPPARRDESPLVRKVSDAVYAALPKAPLGGIFGSAVAGTVQKSPGFVWVHEVWQILLRARRPDVPEPNRGDVLA